VNPPLLTVAIDIAMRRPAADCATLAAAAAGRGRHGLREIAHTSAGPALRDAAHRLLVAWTDETSPAEIAGLLRGAAGGIDRQRHAERIDVVWTGPSSTVHTSRATEAVVADLVDTARSSLLLVSYAVYPYPRLERALRAAAGRGVEIVLLLERTADNRGLRSRSTTQPFPGLPALRWHWPANHRSRGASLHAKLIVVDDHTVLVGSANLTGRAIHDNLECGLLIRGGSTPRHIRAHLTDLLHQGILARA
jgi:cardiolipin synthase A/B